MWISFERIHLFWNYVRFPFIIFWLLSFAWLTSWVNEAYDPICLLLYFTNVQLTFYWDLWKLLDFNFDICFVSRKRIVWPILQIPRPCLSWISWMPSLMFALPFDSRNWMITGTFCSISTLSTLFYGFLLTVCFYIVIVIMIGWIIKLVIYGVLRAFITNISILFLFFVFTKYTVHRCLALAHTYNVLRWLVA